MAETPIPLDAARRVAQRQMRRGDWTGAARSLAGHLSVPELEFQERFCRNMSALATRDPRLALRVATAPDTGRYALALDPGGRRTILRRKSDTESVRAPAALGVPRSEAPLGPPPAAGPRSGTTVYERLPAAGALSPEARGHLDRGEVPALLGFGDGSRLLELTAYRPRLLPGQELCLWVIEPDLEALRHVFMTADFTGPQGPLEQPRVQWLLGPDWERDFAAAIAPDSFLPHPDFLICEGAIDRPLSEGIQAVVNAKLRTLARLREENLARYRALSARHWLDLLRRRWPRKPRVLFVTCAFTTVLKYATADLAQTFAEMGWETDTIIEAAPYHKNNTGVVTERIHRFHPDLVWVIDYLRSFIAAFPPELPHVSWLMDHRSELLMPDAAPKLTARDFVLTFNRSLFTDVYGYPERQCLDMPLFLARNRAPQRVVPTARPPDLIYLSHVSETPEEMARRLTDMAAQEDRAVVAAGLEALMDVYRRGGHCPNLMRDLVAILVRIYAERAQRAYRPVVHGLVEVFLSHLASLLYRQQGLRWVARAAGNLGLELGIYGSGWERHPEFGPYARGVVSGAQRDALLGSAPCNFFLECWPAMSHARLLDALRCGGFVLQRELPLTVLTQRLLRFLTAHLPPAVETLAQARAAVAPERRPELEALATALAPHVWTVDGDPVRSTRCWQRMGVFASDVEEALPDLAAVSFHDEASCRERIRQYLNDPAARAAIAERQRESLGRRLDYRRGVRRTLAFIRRRLREERPA